jgi:hypothetical protein
LTAATLVRRLLTIALVLLVYRETGPFTALFAALVGIQSEAQAWALKEVERAARASERMRMTLEKVRGWA